MTDEPAYDECVRLRAELAAANDSIERSKDYESELRQEYEQMHSNFIMADAAVKNQREAVQKWQTEVVTLRAEVELWQSRAMTADEIAAELRAEVERLTASLKAEEYHHDEYVKCTRARITELEAEVKIDKRIIEEAIARITELEGALEKIAIQLKIETAQALARAALSQEKK